MPSIAREHLGLLDKVARVVRLGVYIATSGDFFDQPRVEPRRLAEFTRNAVAGYAIPRSQLAKAKARDTKYNSTEAVTALVEQARRSFNDLAKTGEGGEMLLFLLAERFLKTTAGPVQDRTEKLTRGCTITAPTAFMPASRPKACSSSTGVSPKSTRTLPLPSKTVLPPLRLL